MSDKRNAKQRLLEAACLVFAEKGYRGATVQDLCEAGGVNVAAVNYYYGSKSRLYLAVWEHVHAAMKAGTERLSAIADPRRRLSELIRLRLHHVFDDGLTGCLRRLTYREMGDPTEVHDAILDRFVWPQIADLGRLVAAVLGVDADDARATRCAFSIHSQLVFLNVLRIKGKTLPLTRLFGSPTPTGARIGEFEEHLVTFVLGGIAAVGRKSAGAPGRKA
ncbi:MAG: CerR family C-terminal domain-containing protein [Verrucomicrobia bacterium]|nr:CerR family C-terminal domain-containing protein [Verrucomicrobiota bacterium]